MTLLNGTGLAAWVLFYLIYFVKNALLRRSGIRANRIGKGEKPSAAARVEHLLGPVTLTLGVLQPLSLWPGLLQPLSLPDVARWAGILLALVGDGVFLLSVYRMGASWRAGVDATQHTALVTDGIYAHSRNPAFLGFDLLYLGLALAAPNPPHLLLAALGVLTLHLQILQEEAYLSAAYGDAYQSYRRRVRRYF